LKGKVSTVYAAATFCSSFLLLVSLFNAQVAKMVADTLVSIVLAGITGVLHSITELCPYSIHEVTKRKSSSDVPINPGSEII
jgi:hypothetical protein